MIHRLESRQLLAAALADGILTVRGTAKADTITVVGGGANIVVAIGKDSQTFARADVDRVSVDGQGGNDRITVTYNSQPILTSVYGGSGNDVLQATTGTALLHGGAGDDTLTSGAGRDTLIGGGGDDVLRGGAGRDTLNGSDGVDHAITEAGDLLLNVNSADPAHTFVPMELTELGLTIATDITTNNPVAKLSFATVPNGAKFDVHWQRRKGNAFIIVADVQRNSDNWPLSNQKKDVSISFGKQPIGTYTVEVWSGTGHSRQVTPAFTTTVA